MQLFTTRVGSLIAIRTNARAEVVMNVLHREKKIQLKLIHASELDSD